MTNLTSRTCAFVLGTRPEAIKLAPLVLAMQERSTAFRPLLWLTGQHRELLDQVLDLFGLAADADLALMQPNQAQASLVGRALQQLDGLIEQHRPAWIVVQGDTSTALSGALAAFYRQVPVAHVEAGLRTHDLSAPFPEEGNRQMISRIASLHCAPTALAVAKLRAEGIEADNIVMTGNTVVDAIRWVARQPGGLPVLPAAFVDGRRRCVLATLHRRESFGSALTGMLGAIRTLADDADLDLNFVLPVHPNPNVHSLVHELLGGHPRVALLPPLGYRALAAVMAQSWLVLTDSGGLQEEAPSLRKPVLVLRDVTERPEGVSTGVAELVGTRPANIVAAVRRLAHDEASYRRMAEATNPYGDGCAAIAILNAIAQRST